MNWISVNDKLPSCSRNPDARGVAVLIWPRTPLDNTDVDGFCYFGRRATGQSAFFYLFGSEINGVTHWMPMPEGPKERRTKKGKA
jgi:hypothetical protein